MSDPHTDRGNSVVGKRPGYGMVIRGNGVPFTAGAREFSLLQDA